MQKHGVVFMVTLVLSAGCLSGGGLRPYRLYPPAPQPLAPERVSTLEGHVQFVDDKDVSSLGGYFELLPGCHVIGTPSHLGVPSPGRTAVSWVTTGEWTFALPMKAGYQYRIEVIMPSVRTVPLKVKGYESDLRGNQTRTFERATSPNDIEACRQEAARSLGQEPGASRP
jgi:hypothetical protein